MIILRNGIYWLDTTLADGSRIRRSLRTRNKSEAKLKVSEVLRDAVVLSPSPSPTVPDGKPGTVTLREAFRRCMYEREQWRTSRSPKTLDGNFRALAYYFGEHTDLSELTRQRIMDYVEWLRKTNPAISPSTVNQRLSMVSVLLETAAYTWGFPIDPFKMPRAKPRPGRTRIVRQDEEERILGALGDDEPMVALVECLIDTGCRLSEMLNLDVRRDVLWDFGFIIVHQSKTDVPKQVPMTSRVRARLAGTKEGLRNPFGGLTVYEADRRFRKVREALGLQDDKELVLHSLRHTAASRLAAAGIDAFRIQKFMGHRNVTTTQRYVTLYGTDIQDLTRVFEKVP